MFSIGFWELALIALVALLVVGPKELPTLLRSVSRWVRQAREVAGEFRNELSREVDRAEELKRQIERETEVAEMHKMLDDARSTIPIDAPARKGEATQDPRPDSKPDPESDPAPDSDRAPSSRDRDGQTP
jgi:sec-independent protein translocase protein TatB